MEHALKALIEAKLISSASLSSNEPVSLNTCLSLLKSIKENIYCFEHTGITIYIDSTLKVELATSNDIPAVKPF